MKTGSTSRIEWAPKLRRPAFVTGGFDNTCAIGMCYALNQSRLSIPAVPGSTKSGADGKNYFYTVEKPEQYLTTELGAPDVSALNSGLRDIMVFQ